VNRERGERVRERFRILGYWKDGKPDVSRFAVERGYIPSYLYRWLAGETPRGESLFRFAADLKVEPQWLVTGSRARNVVRRLVTILLTAGVLGQAGTIDIVPQVHGNMPLIGRWRLWWHPCYLQPLAA
jgi:hypothetical protein